MLIKPVTKEVYRKFLAKVAWEERRRKFLVGVVWFSALHWSSDLVSRPELYTGGWFAYALWIGVVMTSSTWFFYNAMKNFGLIK